MVFTSVLQAHSGGGHNSLHLCPQCRHAAAYLCNMLESLDLEQILFLDIETVPAAPVYDDLPPAAKPLWQDKARAKYRTETEALAREQYPSAGLYAEFGKVICISVGVFQRKDKMRFFVRSFAGADEAALLADFAAFADDLATRPDKPAEGRRRVPILAAHNGKEFDFPYLCRRMLVHGIRLPAPLQIQGKKPWEVMHLDTMELWKFGDQKAFTSLRLLAHIFGLQSPKDDIDGSDIYRVFYHENGLERIRLYCQKDVITVARLLQKMRYEQPVPDDDVVFL
jgi:hypothetical protein